jgi:tetratricopeptide (TPR) repeat protein
MALSNLPERNPFFTGREDVLTRVQEALAAQGRAALSGLGGVGKTQTVLEYAHRHVEEYLYTFFVIAHSQESLVSSYVTIAGLLKLPKADSQDQMLAVEAVEHWLGSHEGWLLILDNADDIGMAREFIPLGKNGHVLLTTQACAVGTMARRVEIQKMGIEEGGLFVLRRAKYIAEDTPLNVVIEVDQSTAKEIAKQLDGLPLALDQAGAYLEETGCGLAGYLDLYRNHAPKLLQHRGVLASDHPDPVTSTWALWFKRLLGYLRLYQRGVPELLRHRRALAIDHPPVATTWALSFEKIKQANPAAAELLRFCAFLHPDGIPEELLSKGASEIGPVLGPVGSDSLALNRSISEILKYSLLRRDSNTSTLEIHRLVQVVLKEGMDQATQELWAERAVRAVNRAFPRAEFSAWAVCERLLPQAHACAELIGQLSFEFLEGAQLLNHAGFYLYERRRYTDAEPLYQRALAIREKALRPEHPRVASVLNNLALLYQGQGQPAKAEPLYERALAIREKALGPEDPEVASSLNSLAHFYQDQGQPAKAEPLYERALAIREKALGPEHPEVASSLNSLAHFYQDQGQPAKAEPLYKKALAIRKKVLNSKDPDVAMSLYGLAELYRAQRQYAQAKPLYRQALKLRKKALGPEHPDVAETLYGLARLCRAPNQYLRAKLFYQRALKIWEKALGPEHPDVAKCLKNYANLLRKMGRPDEAEPLEARAKAIRANTA